ncbi:hypothetical protein [Phyllobacterium chamaecytisi]|uniref:hypothetical protein n=1 Tax=Phyllobacterium chamaecytisi TaxID=2876082 RepID=UPI001CCABD67|nr:hypothetical protein [Phyllobacterium sp. KW56]MBZ9600770.1 hypothetical protein [Phyllobacterium sp. KW56]
MMKFVSAQYVGVDKIKAVDEQGVEYFIPAQSDVSPWPEYIASGGAVDPYIAPEPVIPDVVSSRQFFLQLAIAGISEQVEEWIAQQDALVQIAFNKSATFRRSDEMLQHGFTGLGFTVEQVDGFFAQASLL